MLTIFSDAITKLRSFAKKKKNPYVFCVKSGNNCISAFRTGQSQSNLRVIPGV